MVINHNKAMGVSEEILQIYGELKNICSEINSITHGLSLGRATEGIKQQLRNIIFNMENGIDATKSLGEALDLIVKEYQKTEDLVVSNIKSAIEKSSDYSGSVSIMSSEGTGTDKRGFLSRLWGFICGDEADEYEATGSEQELAADLAIKKELWTVLQDEKYSDVKWSTYTIDEKKQVLQDYMDNVIEIYGLQDVKTQIVWDPSATYETGRITWGYYIHDNHTVTLNEAALQDSISRWDSYTLIVTVSHELRHAYQYEAIDHPTDYMVTKETIDSWDNSFDNYISFDEDRIGYLNQAVEVDARDFEISRNDVL